MSFYAAALSLLLIGAAEEKAVVVVQPPESPVRLDHATVLMPADGPPVLLYAATNSTGTELDQFTVMVFVFDEQGVLKIRQIAPGRRTLEPKASKYSTMVLDGGAVDPADQIVIGVSQAQNTGSDDWWRADLQPLADAAKRKK